MRQAVTMYQELDAGRKGGRRRSPGKGEKEEGMKCRREKRKERKREKQVKGNRMG